MLVTPEKNRRNQLQALGVAAVAVVLAGLSGAAWPPLWAGLALGPLLYWLVRRSCLRRLAVMQQPFPAAWEEILDPVRCDGGGIGRERHLVADLRLGSRIDELSALTKILGGARG